MTLDLILQFLALTLLVSGIPILILRHVFITSVEGAKQRLERDAEAARAREAELNRKIRAADDELAARKRELDLLEQKMKGDLEADANKHKEELVNKARAEAEEIITKAQTAADGIRREMEKQMEIRFVDHAARLLGEVLSKKAKLALEKDLADEFIVQLQTVDMSRVSPDIRQAEVVTTAPMADADLKRIDGIIQSRTGRTFQVTAKVEPGPVAGVLLRFGSLHLDGSLRAALRDSAIALKTEIEKGAQAKA